MVSYLGSRTFWEQYQTARDELYYLLDDRLQRALYERIMARSMVMAKERILLTGV